MKSLKNIFNKPILVEGVGSIYPVKLKDYDDFEETSDLLYISRNHFASNDIPLLALMFGSASQLLKLDKTIEEEFTPEEAINKLLDKFIKLFSIVTNSEVSFISGNNMEGFLIGISGFISTHNYDIVREIIMRQNLMFEQKVFKNKKVQEWANKVLETKSKNQPKIDMEEMLSTVSIFTGKHYWDLENYTIYQIYSDFYRIRKMKSYDVSAMARCQGHDIEIDDFAEDLDIYKNPYDDLFVDSGKLNKYAK
jgi:hypothetical protein